jgi:hypothetical protein
MSRLVLSFGLVLGLGAAAQAADFTMKLSSSSAEDAEFELSRRDEGRDRARLQGQDRSPALPRGQLGSQSAMIQGLQLGTIEGIHIPADFFAGVDPRMGVLSFPFLFKDRKHANRVLADPVLANRIAEMLDSRGIVGCGPIATADVRYMLRGGIHKLADFNGKKLRINGYRRRARALQAARRDLGADEPPRHDDGRCKTAPSTGSGSGLTIMGQYQLLDSVPEDLLHIEDTLILSNCAMSKQWLDTLPAGSPSMVIKESRALFKKWRRAHRPVSGRQSTSRSGRPSAARPLERESWPRMRRYARSLRPSARSSPRGKPECAPSTTR